uniref:Partitioning defective 3 homolog B-like n=1 Tax=Neolamprologus brichardi TaxID=32507 RepID=A0A3Q4HMZ5_NEOBR
MKVTVTFGQTGVVVPCKEGWTVRDLIQQATQRYRKLLEQEGDFFIRTHHVEYCDGGILDPDDILSDLVEDKDKLMAVYEEHEAQQRSTANTSLAPSPDHYQSELSVFQPITGGEIEVNSSALKSNTPLLVRSSSDSALSPQPADLTRMVEILGEDSPLGIHVVPYCSSLSGRALGLYIRGVEEESRSRKDGLFQEDECIVKINDTNLLDKTFSQSQDVFRQAMRSPVVRLEVVPSFNRERYEKSLIGQLFGNNNGPTGSPRTGNTKEPPPPVKAKPVFKPSENSTPKGKSESPLLKKSPALSSLMANKRGGRRLRIDLKKGPEGLGFTVVTRDSSVHGPGPILVKNILPRGAAVKDGRLQSGDRILEVNGVDITGVGQEELVCMLRSTRQGESVSLVVLRQEDIRVLRGVSRVPSVVSENGKEQLMFEVPLNDTGSAGLGVSLKGNKSRETGEDLGIFIKSIIHGGAAYKDGRLHVNDQLVAVNGESLLGRPNHMAMETLRRSMSQEGNVRGTIQLVVLRALKVQVLPRNNTRCNFHTNKIRALFALCFICLREKPHVASPAQPQSPTQNQNQWQIQHVKASKSMDLGTTQNQHHTGGDLIFPLSSSPLELGPTLGLKKSSSLESLQTAMSEVNRKNELLPFHHPRPNMVRGRGCNESFRAAIDKSYDGPAEDDDGKRERETSGRDTPASSSSRQGVGDQAEEKGKKEKKKKAKTKKKEKSKVKGKEKEKKKTEEPEETEKKSKKIGFVLRFLSRIEASHPELQDQRQGGGGGSAYPDFEDDDADPNYARIQSFRDRDMGSVPQPLSQSPPYRAFQHALIPDDDPLDRLYAKVNKSRGAGTTSPPAPPQANDSHHQTTELFLHTDQHLANPPLSLFIPLQRKTIIGPPSKCPASPAMVVPSVKPSLFV